MHSGQILFTFFIGGVVGVLLGWYVARSWNPSSPPPPPQGVTSVARGMWNEGVTFLKNALLLAGAIVVVLFLAANIVHSRR